MDLQRKKKLKIELDRILNLLTTNYNPQKVIVFGSFIKNNIHEDSDLDILIIKDVEKRYLERIDEVLHLIHPKLACDIFVFNEDEINNALADNNPYIKEILDKGKVIYEK